jgi:purine-binding chemotaxis protein CheW
MMGREKLQAEMKSSQTDHVEYVAFSVATQRYCLEITKIREIRGWSPVTALPHAPVEVLGVMNLRGAVIAIIDLAEKFGLGKTKANKRNVVIVVSVGGSETGLLVEAVSEIITGTKEEIQETPEVKSDATKKCIRGVVCIDGELTRIVALDEVISS